MPFQLCVYTVIYYLLYKATRCRCGVFVFPSQLIPVRMRAGRTGSIALWDNRCTQHLPVHDCECKLPLWVP